MTSNMVESAWANVGFFLYQLDPEVRRLVRRLECFHLKILKKKQSTVFNQTSLSLYIYIVITKREFALLKQRLIANDGLISKDV